MIRQFLASLLLGASAISAVPAQAAEFPNKPVKLVVSLAAGSATDLLARQVGRWLEEEWKQPVIIENRPGAGGLVAADYVARQPADGHTMLLAGSAIVIAPLIDKNAGSRIGRELTPAARLAVLRIVLATNPDVPARSLQEFAALARSQPGKLNYAGLGRTSLIDMGIEVIMRGLKMNLTPVTYKGAVEHNTALIRNDVQLVWGGASVLREHAATGKIRILAAVSEQRFADMPDVPTVGEAGHTGFLPKAWTGLIVPAATPPGIVEQINRDINRILSRLEVSKVLRDVLGNDPAPLPSGAFAEEVRRESQVWTALFKELNIEPR